MSFLTKYNIYDSDIVKGDVIVFLDGRQKEVKKVEDHHRLYFTDGKRIDLYCVDIKGIIKIGHRPILETFKIRCDVTEKSSKEIITEPIKSKATPLTYNELFETMDKADKSNKNISKYFYHFTAFDNLVSIINDEKFRSRYDLKDNIPYDNKEKNCTSDEVMTNNVSQRTSKYVRFYFRPLNKPYFALFHGMPPKEQNNSCIICIRREALKNSFNPTFIYHQNASRADDRAFDFDDKLNNSFTGDIKIRNYNKFDFDTIYTSYQKNQIHDIDLLQAAEFLVYKDLGICFIEKIYFRNIATKEKFILKIKDSKAYLKYNLESKCFVDDTYFGY